MMTRNNVKPKSEQPSGPSASDRCVTINDELKLYIRDIVKDATSKLMTKIEDLQNQVKQLQECNEQLINQLQNSDNTLFKNSTQAAEYDNLENSTSSTDTVIQNSQHKKRDKKVTKKEAFSDKHDRRHESKQRFIVGSNNENSNEEFGAPKPRLYLHVFRCNITTTEEKVQAHLQKKLPQTKFEVVKLNTRGENASFRVTTDYEENLTQTLYDPEFWPRGVKVQRFRFFRRKNSGDF